MNREIAEKWIADLRANPPQARLVLFDGTGHCCLGRLCVLAGMIPKRANTRYIFADNDATLPDEVMAWAEIHSSCGSYPYGSLADDNDSGKTFAEIADIIEAHIDEL
jgi:hypothetical protein